MSYQYIYPNTRQNIILNNQTGYNQQSFTPVNNPIFNNPYQTSLYNNSVQYPYFIPDCSNLKNDNYTKIGIYKSPNGETAHKYKLKNGQEVIIVPRKNEATNIKAFINTGSMNETDKIRGVQHVDEHGLFKGSKNLKDGDVFRLASSMGATTNASTDYAKVDYYISAPDMDEKNLQKGIEIIGDMVSHPLFDKEAMESEKEPVCSEISMMLDDPNTIAFDKVIRNLYQIKSDSQNMVAGSIETVKALTTDDMKSIHQTYYTPENVKAVIVCDDNPDKVIDLVVKNFDLKPNNNQTFHMELNPIEKPVRQDIRSSKTNFTNVFIAFAGPKPKNSKDFIISQMLGYYLGQCSTSDLKNNLEKMNAGYDFSSQKISLKEDDPYALISALSLNPNDEQKALDIFYDAIFKLQNNYLTDDEMTSIKNNLNKSFALNMSDSDYICDLLGNCLLNNNMDLFTNYSNIINSITKQDIMNFAKKYYDLNKASIVVLHPSKVSENDIQENYKKSKYSQNNINQNQLSFKGVKRITTKDVKEYLLDNNTHLAINDTNSDLCVFNWSVNTPPVKPKNPNAPLVLRYIFEKGTDYKSQQDLEQYKELNGIDADVYVNGKSIEINANCLAKDASKTLDLMKELMYHPKFTNKDFEEAKSYVKDMLQASQKDASSNLLERLYPGYFSSDSYKLKQIDNLKYEDIIEFYNDLLKNASSAFVATLPKQELNTLSDIVINSQNTNDIKFQKLTDKLYPLFEAEKQINIIYDTDDLNQAQIYKSYKFPISGNIEDEVKFEMLNTILGATPAARLFSDLREKQNLAYSVSSRIQSFENTGILTLKIQTTTDNPTSNITSYDNVQKSLGGFQKHADMLKNEYVTDEELQAAKTKLKQNIIGQCQNPISETGLLAMNILEPYGIKRIDKYFEAIDKITKEDIKQAANFIFSYNPTISILASQNTINSQMDYLNSLGNVQKAA